MDLKLFERVCNAPGVPGHEEPVQAVATDVLEACCDEVRSDRLGNVIGLKRAATRPAGPARPLRVMISAHADEIGMMVKHVDDRGFISFAPLGGLNPAVIVSQRVVIHGKKPLRGVIVPDSRPDRKDKVTPVDQLFIDTGLDAKVVLKRVTPGDVVTFDRDVSQLNDKVYTGRNFDDRVGTYCLLEAMRRLGRAPVDVYAVSSVQEEVGLRGARVAAYAIDPDIGIAIDGSITTGAYDRPPRALCDMGKGTGVYILDNLTIGSRRLVQFLLALCERFKIPHQRNIGGGTDAAAMQQTRGGVLSTTVGAPVRYMHSTVQLCHADDIEATIRLLVTFVERAHEHLAGEEARATPSTAGKRRAAQKPGRSKSGKAKTKGRKKT